MLALKSYVDEWLSFASSDVSFKGLRDYKIRYGEF